MRRVVLLLVTAAAVFMAVGSLPGGNVQASHSLPPKPLLNCADLNGDGPVSVGDIGRLVLRFGSNDGGTQTWAAANWTSSSYHPLFDLTTAGTGAISSGDIVVAVSDFGLDCRTVSPVDAEISRGTLDIIDPTYHPAMSTGLPDFPGDPGLLTENVSLLASKGYYRASTDVPGQGVHYVNETYFTDNLYYETTPEGLVYESGRLRAQLYFINGDDTDTDGDPDEGGVGWGGVPPDADQINIDAFCVPNSPNTKCSWSGSYDGWHDHVNLCTVAIGHPSATAIPGSFSGWTEESQCQNAHNQWCGGSKCPGTTYRWNNRVGWMGHMWNHTLNANANSSDVGGNGRFADCFPDTEHWTAYNCPG